MARVGFLPLVLSVALLGPALVAGQEPAPAKMTEKQAQAACAAMTHLLGSQRPEGVLGSLALITIQSTEPAPVPPLLLDDRARGPVVAVQVAAAGSGPLSAAYLRVGLQQGLWLAKPARDPRIDKNLLAGIEHRRPLHGSNRHEALSYNIVVLHAKEVSDKDLARIARKDVFYVNLWEDPQRYIGEPIHITGQMRRLVRMDAPRSMWNDGVKTLYEGWVYPNQGDGDNPYCIVFSELPKNVKTGEKVSYPISCDAYFFKLYRYETKERGNSGRRVVRDTPMFIGHSFVRTGSGNSEPEDNGWSISAVTHVLPTCTGAVIVIIGFVIGLNWWFRRGDRAVRDRIRDTRGTFVPPPPDNAVTDLPVEEPRTSRFGREN